MLLAHKTNNKAEVDKARSRWRGCVQGEAKEKKIKGSDKEQKLCV